MQLNNIIFRELIKRGYSLHKKKKVWDLSDSKLWCFTKEHAQSYLKFEEYTPYRKNVIDEEMKLIKGTIKEIIHDVHSEKFNIIDAGCGSGVKAERFIDDLPKGFKVRYCPLDSSPYLVQQAVSLMKKRKRNHVTAVKPFVETFENLGDFAGMVRTSDYQRNVILMLGSTLSHIDADDILFQISKEMFPGDVMVIGNGLRKGKRFVDLEKYYTPHFNTWFMHTMNGLGFKDTEVKYRARFANNRLELYYIVQVDKKISSGNKTVNLKAGDEILVAVQYKFFQNEFKKLCKRYFSKAHFVLAKNGEYVVAICTK